MRWLGVIELAGLAALAFSALAAGVAAGLWPLLRPRLHRWHPGLAGAVTFCVATAPAWAPALGVALCLAPGLLGGLGLGEDHCPHHAGHPHLCLHHPAIAQGGAPALLLTASAAGAALLAVRGARRVARARRAFRALERESRDCVAGDARLLATDAALSLTVGVLRPRTLVSRGLADALSPAALACVLAHESEHRRRRDALRGLLATALSWPHLPTLRRAVLGELRLAAERSCDEAAAKRVGDRLLVAETILQVERMSRQRGAAPRGAIACAFGESDVAPRVAALLAAPAREPRRGLTAAVIAASAGLSLLAAPPLHHATEHLLRALLALG